MFYASFPVNLGSLLRSRPKGAEYGRGGGNRTPIGGFGDRSPTIERHPRVGC